VTQSESDLICRPVLFRCLIFSYPEVKLDDHIFPHNMLPLLEDHFRPHNVASVRPPFGAAVSLQLIFNLRDVSIADNRFVS
jgi:hypothetical protein